MTQNRAYRWAGHLYLLLAVACAVGVGFGYWPAAPIGFCYLLVWVIRDR